MAERSSSLSAGKLAAECGRSASSLPEQRSFSSFCNLLMSVGRYLRPLSLRLSCTRPSRVRTSQSKGHVTHGETFRAASCQLRQDADHGRRGWCHRSYGVRRLVIASIKMDALFAVDDGATALGTHVLVSSSPRSVRAAHGGAADPRRAICNQFSAASSFALPPLVLLAVLFIVRSTAQSVDLATAGSLTLSGTQQACVPFDGNPALIT